MRTIFRLILLVALSLNCRAQIVPILRNVFTTNTFDTDIVGGAIPYFDFPSGKFVGSPTAYSNAIFYDPSLGFLSIVHTNDTGDLLLNLAVAGAASPSIQGYADKFVVANTNLTLDAVGPFSIRLRINGSNVLEAVAGNISLSGQTNLVADNGSALTYNGVPIGGAVTNSAILQTLYYGGQYGFGASSVTPTNIRSSNLSAGMTDVFTVPAGKRFVISDLICSGTNLSAVSANCFLKTNGLYYRVGGGASVVTNSNGSISLNSDAMFWEAGETVGITNSAAGVNIAVIGTLFSTNIPAHTDKLFSLAAGNNTLYTCPAGKCAVGFRMGTIQPFNPDTVGVYVNDSAANRTLKFYVVPSGGSADNSNIQFTKVVANQNRPELSTGVLFPGDSIVLNVDANTATQWARFTVAEIPFP